MKSTLKISLALLLLIVCNACDDPCTRNQYHDFPKSEWIGMLNDLFRSASIRLNNYTPIDHQYYADDERAFLKPNDSYLSLGSLGTRLNFGIPLQRSNPYSLYVNNINSTRFAMDTRNRDALISISFESAGREVIGNCVNNFFCFCGDPQVDLNNMEVELQFSLIPRDGRLSIENIRADMSADYSETGPCVNNACAFACDLFAPDRENKARESLRNALVRYFNDNRALVEVVLNRYVQGLGVRGEITAVAIGPTGNLVIAEQYPTPC